ncbi:MAG: hypothetical protein IT450_09710 [Phycisphaerales bacterium]|nr:hypothetical protein [Phycisphaerales bacterium]
MKARRPRTPRRRPRRKTEKTASTLWLPLAAAGLAVLAIAIFGQAVSLFREWQAPTGGPATITAVSRAAATR